MKSKVELSDIIEHFKGQWGILALMLPGLFYCIYYAANGNIPFAAAICAIPFCLMSVAFFIHYPTILFILLFSVNYCIMGAIRYIHVPIPISVLMDMLLLFMLFVLAIGLFKRKIHFPKEVTPFIILYSIWIIFCFIELFNNTTGIGFQYAAWFREVRPMAFHALYIILIFGLLIKKPKDLKYFLYLWGFFILLATAKGYWQRNRGFDQSEWQWLMAGGANTHLINTGVRYFSFFSDAANFGSNMAFSLVTYGIIFLYEKNRYAKIFFFTVALAAGYGMMISGTRSAIFVAIAGFMLYTILSKSTKLFFISLSFLIVSVSFLKYTTIGESNGLIRRMRTAFNPEDASFQVRLENQKAIKSYMSEAPWGIGIGVGPEQIPVNNKYWILSVTAPDSTLVHTWMRTGAIGISIYLFVLLFPFILECYIIFFKIKDKHLRGILTAFICGYASMIVAAYGNFIFNQYPNILLVYGLQTLVFMGPYFDRQITAQKEEKERIEVIELKENEEE